MSINSVNSIFGMAYPYMNPYTNQIPGAYLGSYGYINSLSGMGYGNLIQPTSIDNAESFAKILEKISEKGNRQNEIKPIEQKAEISKAEKVQNTIPMTMVSRNIPRINVVTGIENMEVKKMNPYVTVYCRK